MRESFTASTDWADIVARRAATKRKPKDGRRAANRPTLEVETRRTRAALRERVKELTCLYGLALLTRRPNLSVPLFLEETAELLPPAWQYPDRAAAEIRLDQMVVRTRRFGEAVHSQTAPLRMGGRKRGSIEVRYIRPTPGGKARPFLAEEQQLLDTVATQLSHELQRREVEQKGSLLETQLRHADRLATIGQLGAGMAHELNEPLANILGLAQLLTRDPSTPPAAQADLNRIVDATLHTREIVKRLMQFVASSPTQTMSCDLNRLVKESLTLVEPRCARSGVKLQKLLSTDVPPLEADPVQVRQVVVNLAVNAVQAMPEGGTLTVATRREGDQVCLRVQDTGTGMTEEVKGKLFMPFFTTKAQEGTGLGLSVTHGIVTAHGGSIRVESTLGRGSTFEVRLPVKPVGTSSRGADGELV